MKSRWLSKINNKHIKLWLSDETKLEIEPMAAIFLQATHLKNGKDHQAKNDEVMIGTLTIKQAHLIVNALNKFIYRYEDLNAW